MMNQQFFNVTKHPLLWRGLGRLFLSLFLISFHLSSAAQTPFTQRIQQDVQAGARVIIHQDAAITELVNGKTVTATPPRQTTDRPRQQNNDRPRQQNNDNNNNQPSGRTDIPVETATTTTEPVQETDSIAVVPRRTRKMAGFRVQPYVGGNSRADRVKAEQTGATLQTLFPGHRVYVHFLGGKWTCRLGDFRTMAEAKEVLDELVKMGYDRAMMVRGQINVPY